MSTPPFAEPIDDPIAEPVEPPDDLMFLLEPPSEPSEPVEPAEPVEETAIVALAAPAGALSSDQFIQTAESVTVLSTALASKCTSEALCQVATDYANTVHAWIKAAEAHFDPLVERARKPYQDRLDERNAVLKPLLEAKERLTGKTGAVTRWIAEQKRLAHEKAAAEQRENDRIAAEARMKADKERIAAELQRREAAAKVEREKAEQAQRIKEAQDARERGDRAAAEEADRLAKEATARASAAREEVAVAAAAAAQAEETRDNVVAEVAKAEAPVIAGAQTKKRWTWEPSLPDTLMKKELAKAIAYPLNGRAFIEQICAVDGWQTATGSEIVALLEHLIQKFEAKNQVPAAVLTVDTKYVNARVRDDGDVLKWPGIRIWDGGSVAVGGRSKKATS